MSILLNLESSRLDTSQTSHDFEIQFNPALHLNERIDYEIALRSATMWYAWYNISAALGNNIFKYFNGAVNRTLTIPNGAYELTTLNDELTKQMLDLGDKWTDPDGVDQPFITLEGNSATLRVIIKIKAGSGYTVDLRTGNLRDILGFASKVLTETEEGDYDANIENDIDSIHIHCSIVCGTYINSSQSDVIYTSTINVPPGAQMQLTPFMPVFLPVTTKDIYSIRMRITDQLGRPLNMNSEPVSYSLVIRPTRLQRDDF